MYSKTVANVAVGKHIYGSFYECENEIIKDHKSLKKLIIKAVEVAKAKLVKAESYKIGEYVSAIAIVMESHIAIHAWPKYKYATVDVFTCGDTDPEAAFKFITEILKPKGYTKYYTDRSNRK